MASRESIGTKLLKPVDNAFFKFLAACLLPFVIGFVLIVAYHILDQISRNGGVY